MAFLNGFKPRGLWLVQAAVFGGLFSCSYGAIGTTPFWLSSI
jgi:hypothetical protein